MSMLRAENLTVGYEKKEVVKGINIEAVPGEVLCLLGPNGSGKTTILRTLSGLQKPIGGEVFLQGENLHGLEEGRLAKQLAVVLTERLSLGLTTVFEVAAMGRYMHTGFFGRLSPRDIELINEALKLVNTSELAHRYFNQLSDGEKQKVLLARALVQEPKVIIMDEPTSFLDIRHKIEFVSILNKLSREKGITIVVSLHEIELAIKCSDRVMLIKEGRVLDYGSPEDVLTVKRIKELYGIRGAEYNQILGSFELPVRSKKTVFVLAGSGSGSLLYRALAKNDIGIYTGILHENDIDYEVAKTLGSGIVSEVAFEEIGDAVYGKALERIMEFDRIIDAGYPVGKLNRANISLAMKALEEGKTILTLRSEEEAEKVYGSLKNRVVNYKTITDLMKAL